MSSVTNLSKRLGGGKEAEVFEAAGGVLKLYRAGAPKASVFREAAHLALVERLGLPAPRVQGVEEVEGRWGLMMSLTPGESFGDVMVREPESIPQHLAAMSRLHRSIHGQPGTGFSSLKTRLRRDIKAAPALDDRRRERLLRHLGELPDDDRLCHGDFHGWNVLGTPDNATVVDWLDAACGPPAADLARSYLLMLLTTPALAPAYANDYNASEAGLLRDEMATWLPILAAGRLAEGVRGEEKQLHDLIGRL